jgi:hypothetical protein
VPLFGIRIMPWSYYYDANAQEDDIYDANAQEDAIYDANAQEDAIMVWESVAKVGFLKKMTLVPVKLLGVKSDRLTIGVF